ncbi:MAG: hypothetical protein RI943_627 [Bacteroidota bacterium]|jgi:hypothetical protein
MAKGKNQYIVPIQGGWGIHGEGNNKLTKKTKTKAEAMEIGKAIAKNQQAELIVMGKNFKIQNKNSFGNDPFPPRDKKY